EQVLVLSSLLLTLLIAGLFTNVVASSLRPWIAGTRAQGWIGPLPTQGGELVDITGQEVHLAGVNWFGFETASFAPHGLDVRNYQSMLDQMARLGFNVIRLPFSDQLFDPASRPTDINYQLNPDLRGLQGLALMDKIVDAAGQRGMRVILDRHRPN